MMGVVCQGSPQDHKALLMVEEEQPYMGNCIILLLGWGHMTHYIHGYSIILIILSMTVYNVYSERI